jgi:hypothetical protein
LQHPHFVAFEPGIHPLNDRKASQQESRADDEQQRESDLDDDERAANAAPGRATLTFAERRRCGRARELDGRRQARDDRRHYDQRTRHGRRAGVERYVIHPRDVRRPQARDEIEAPARDEQSEAAAHRRE